jgi:hypothetical protein
MGRVYRVEDTRLIWGILVNIMDFIKIDEKRG